MSDPTHKCPLCGRTWRDAERAANCHPPNLQGPLDALTAVVAALTTQLAELTERVAALEPPIEPPEGET